jgi:hypothetical protein
MKPPKVSDKHANEKTPVVDVQRRALLVALGAGLGSPLVGCGGGGEASSTTPTPTTKLDITPTVTFDGAATSGLTTNYAYLSGSSQVNDVFSYSGAASSNVTQLGSIYPRLHMVSADIANSDTLSPGTIYATFYHTGKTLDIIQYGFSDSVTLYINDTFSARYGGALTSGTAQGGSANGIVLASSSSSTSGYYNEYYVRIAGGTGVLNEARQVTSYDGTSFTATVDSPWTTAPDSTTEYVLQEGTQPFVLDKSTGSIKFLHLKWKVAGRRKITVEQEIFAGVSSDGTIAAAPLWSNTPLLVVGDSFWEGVAAPISIPKLIDTFAQSMDWLPTNLSQGGTGYVNRYQAGNRLNFQDRVAPPAEAWRVLRTATGGTFTISVTYAGVTVTTSPLAHNSNNTDIESALNALANVAGAEGYFYVARGDFATPLIFVGHGITGATISFDGSSLSGGSITVLGAYVGDVEPNVPTDSSGNATSFYLLIPGSGNDSTYSDADVQTAATYVAQQIVAKFPTAIPIFTGVFGDCDAGDSLIGPRDISRNAAIAAAAGYLPTIGGKVPFIDTYANGLGGNKIIYGLGTVADPQPGTNSNLKSITSPGHPTGPGSQFLSDWLAGQVKALIA